MLKKLLLTGFLLMSSQAYAADSWFDTALDFLGFGSDAEEVADAEPEKSAETESQSLANAAKEMASNSALGSMAKNAATASLTSVITSQLGVSDAQAKGGLGSLFGLAQASLGSQEFSQLSGAVPEMDSLLAAAPAISENAKGLSSLMGSAGKYGAALQGATQAYSQFKELGIGVEQIPSYISVTNNFLKQQSGDDMASLFQKGVSALLTSENE